MTQRLKREDIFHLLSHAATITNQDTFVVVGSGAAIVALQHIPLDLAYTPDVDIFAPAAPDIQGASDIIDFVIGIGSDFHVENGYYAHGVDQTTSCLPDDWMDRAHRVKVPGDPVVTCICPEIHDTALAKLCAWRDKDREWLRVAYESGLLMEQRLLESAGTITHASAPPVDEITSRIRKISSPAPAKSSLTTVTSPKA